MNAPAQPVPQATPNGYPSMKVVRALAAASKRVAEVTCNGKSGDPRDPYAYARADDLVAAAKDAIHSEGLLVLPASSDEKPEAVGNGAVIWLRQTFNVVHVESGEWLPFQADPWPLQQNKPIDKAMATAKTASKAYFYLSLLEIRRVGPNAEDMDADLPPLSEQTANRSDKPSERSDKPVTDSTQIGISAKAKRGGSAAHMAMKREAENRQKVDPEENAAELAKFAAANFPTEGDQEMPPTPAPTQPAPGNSDTSSEGACKGAPEATPSKASDGASHNSTEALSGSVLPVSDGQPVSAAGPGPRSGPNSGPNFLDQGEWSGVKSVSSAGGESLPPSSSSPPAPGPSPNLDADGLPELVVPSPAVVALVASKASGALSKRTAESRASKWTGAKTRNARKPFWCAECQEEGPNANTTEAIQKGELHLDRDGTPAGRCCLKCYERLESEAAGAGKESAA